jgi:hypothetical protein
LLSAACFVTVSPKEIGKVRPKSGKLPIWRIHAGDLSYDPETFKRVMAILVGYVGRDPIVWTDSIVIPMVLAGFALVAAGAKELEIVTPLVLGLSRPL